MLEPWHWMAFGMLLILAEIFLPSFTAIWFGLGAILVASLDWLMNGLDFRLQLFIWSVSSSVATFLWFKYFRQTMKDKTTAGIAKEAIQGETGYVIKAPTGGRHGLARFTPALLGDDEWPFILVDPSIQDEESESSTSSVTAERSEAKNTQSTERLASPAEIHPGDKVIVHGITGNTLLVAKK